MALPAGVLTANLTFGLDTDDTGEPSTGGRVTLLASTDRVWAATGDVVSAENVVVPIDGEAHVVPWVATDQDGFVNGAGEPIRDWTVSAVIDKPGRARRLVNFALPTGGVDGLVVDFNLLVPVEQSDGQTVAVTMVTSVDGDVGAINLSDTYVGGLSGTFVSVMRRGVTDATLVVLGDSTGNDAGEWVDTFVQALAADYPTHTVQSRLWNDGTQTYAAANVVQVGTGPRTLTVYNCSVPGAGHDYAFTTTARFTAVLPVAPDAVIASYGYNSGTPTYRVQMLQLARWVLGNFPGTEYVVTSQPPVATGNAAHAANLTRRADIRAVAAQEGWGLIDATQPFIDYGPYDELILPDLIHPNAAGYALWVAEVVRYFGSTAPRQQPHTAPAAIDRIFVDASRFIVYSGTPNLAISAGGIIMPAWHFDPTVVEMICTMVDVPPSWRTVNVYLLWTTPGGSTLSVVWQVDHFVASSAMVATVSGAIAGAAVAGAPQTVPSVAAAGTYRSTPVYTAARFAGGRPVAFRVRRLATDGADTYASDAQVYGLLIERAE